MNEIFQGMVLNGIPTIVFAIWGGFVLIELILAITTGVVAGKKGRNGFGWFLIGLFTGIVGLSIILIALPRRYYVEEEE